MDKRLELAEEHHNAEAMAVEDAVESPEEMCRMLHELCVHQVELEMHNEKLHRLQQELDTARRCYFELYDHLPVGCCILGEQGHILQANLAAAVLLGSTKIALITESIFSFIFNEDQESFYLHHRKLTMTGKPQAFDLRMLNSDGMQIWVNLTMTATSDSDDRSAFRVVLFDISERKQAETVLQKNTSVNQDILNSIFTHIAILDQDGVIQSVFGSRRCTAQHSCIEVYTAVSDTDIGANYFLTCQPANVDFASDDSVAAFNGIQAVLDRRLPSYSLEFACHSRRQHWFSLNVSPLGVARQGGVAITHRDITKRKRAEDALRASQEQLESITAEVPGVVCQFVWTLAGECKFLYLSKGIEKLYEVTADEVFRDFSALDKFIPAEDQSSHQEALERLSQNTNRWEYEYRIIMSSGKIKWVQCRANPKQQVDGSIVWSGIMTDISEQKLAEAVAQEREQHYRALLQDACDPVVIADINGNIEEINRSAELMLGYTQHDIRGMSAIKLHPASETPKIRQKFEELFTNGRILPVETKLLRKNGEIIDIEIRPTLVDIGGRILAQGIFIDLTERKRLEEQRLEHEVMLRSVLVREVHHRIKNNLQGITGMLRQFVHAHPETTAPLNLAISQVQSISVIHGLQGRADTSLVRVCELTTAIATGIAELWCKTVIVEIPEAWVACIITEAEAVPVALVLNELILNAVKHSTAPEPVRIKFSHEPNPDSIRLAIYNTGLLPTGFGLEDTGCFRTGLQLAVSLLSQTGAGLTWAQQDGIVITTLSLDTPIIQLESRV
jgi:PAS domain S-box-containing protein